MIRRVTPSKIFPKRNSGLCCGWLCSDGKSNRPQEVSFILASKKEERVANRSFNSADCRRQSSCPVTKVVTYKARPTATWECTSSRPLTPQHQKISPRMKDTAEMPTTTPGTVSTQFPTELPECSMPSTPLDRLKKRISFKREVHNSVGVRLFASEAKAEPHQARTTDCGETSISQSVRKSVMGEEYLLQSSFKRQKMEYEELLTQFESLSRQRQQNLDFYAQMLERIAVKQREVRQKEGGKRVQLHQIRQQIQKLMMKSTP